MRIVLRAMAFATVLTLMPMLHAADLSGTWKGSFDFEGNSVPLVFNLKADGNALSGTVEGLPTTPADIHDGKIDGDAVSFWVNTDYQGQTYKLVYTGKIAADHIDFSFGTEDGSWGSTVTATRAGTAAAGSAAGSAAAPAAAAKPAENLTGAWKGSFDFQGTEMPLTLDLKSDGATVTGDVQGMGAAPVEIHDGKVEGDAVSFWLNTDYQGQTYVLNFKGKITGNQIDFDFGVPDGSWGSSVSVKKS
ncbi:MAG: hypothetical protein ACLGSD_03365 [Acidobacteriota bacterium]